MELTPQQDEELIDRIIYLGSLASSTKDVDPMLDTLRRVTAQRQAMQALSAQDRTTLQGLESRLKDYLINRDPLRSFTAESLERRIAARGGKRANHATRTFWILIAAIAGITALPYLLPWPLAPETRNYFSSQLYLALVTGSIGWFYWSAMRNFKAEARKAFAYMFIGVLFLGLDFVHFTIIISLDLLDKYPLLRYGGITPLSALFYAFFYAGLRKYAGLLGLRTRLTSLPYLAAAIGGLVAISILAPHPNPVSSEFYFDFFFGWLASLIVFGFFVAGLTRKIKQSVTPAYARSMKWLNLYAWLLALGATGGITAVFMLGELTGRHIALLNGASASLQQLLLLYSAYTLKKDTSE